MSTVEEIVNAAKSLPPEQQAELKRRLEALAAAENIGGVRSEGESTPRREELDPSRGTLRELFGSVDLGHPTGADNESIDADLAREYASTHEEVR